MEQFIIGDLALDAIEERVKSNTEIIDYADYRRMLKNKTEATKRCGCGAGGTCASSCVSGCAERGGCGPNGPR